MTPPDLDGALFTMALDHIASRPLALTALQASLSAGCNPNHIVPSGWSNALSACAALGWTDAVRELLAAGADVHAHDDAALQHAADGGHLPVVEALFAAGADVHAHDDAAMQLAAASGRLPIIECLLEHDADVHASSGQALRSAAGGGHLSVVSCLLTHGADVHAEHDEALHRAVCYGHPPVVARLLAAGADATARNNNIIGRALRNADRESTHALLDAGADAGEWWERCTQKQKKNAAATLNAIAAEIPIDQRRSLIEQSPRLFPALCAMHAAARRCVAPAVAGKSKRKWRGRATQP